jgi:hypothetical protein
MITAVLSRNSSRGGGFSHLLDDLDDVLACTGIRGSIDNVVAFA